MEPFLGPAMDRIPSLAEIGVRTFFCGPESFTSDVRPLLGPAPELDGYFVAAGLNSLGILSGGGVGTHDRALDRRRRAAGRRDRASPSTGPRPTRRPAGSGPSAPSSSSACCSATRSGRPGSRRPARNVRRSVLHDRLAAAGAHFGVSAGWEFAEWFAGPARQPVTTPGLPAPGLARDRRARARARSARRWACIDMSLMAKLIVQGPDAAAVLSRLSANDVTARDRAGWSTPSG